METAGERWRLGHRPALDVVRGLAILLVLVGHLTPLAHGAAGKVGVTVFFALSGFLITSLLLQERESAGQIRFGAFYARRARRLLPALIACVAGVALLALLTDTRLVNAGGALSALFYVANIAKAQHVVDLAALGHTWSLSIEEQFYLVWPVLLLVAMRRGGRGAAGVVAVSGSVLAVALRLTLWDGTAAMAWQVYYSSWCRADGLLLGCLLAVAMPTISDRARGPLPATALAALLLPWCLASGWWLYVAMPLAVALTAIGLVFCAVTSPARWLLAPWLQWLGRRSYALYLWHYPLVVFTALRFPDVAWWWTAPVVLLVSLAVTVMSWRFVEQPFLRMKGPPVSSSRSDGARPAATGPVGRSAPTPTCPS